MYDKFSGARLELDEHRDKEKTLLRLKWFLVFNMYTFSKLLFYFKYVKSKALFKGYLVCIEKKHIHEILTPS